MEKILIHAVPPYRNIVYKNINRQATIMIKQSMLCVLDPHNNKNGFCYIVEL